MNLPDDWTASEGVSCAGWDIWIGYRGTKPKYTWAIWSRRINFDDPNQPYTMGKIHGSHDAALAAIKELRQSFQQANLGDIEDLLNPERALTQLPEFGAF